MSNPNGNTPAPGAPAPATPPAPAAAPSPTPAPNPAPAVPSSGGGGAGRDPNERIRYLEEENRRLYAERDGDKAKNRSLSDDRFKELEGEKTALQKQLEERTAAEAKVLGELQERTRMDVRRQYVEAILARVPEGKREDVDLRLAGLEQKGELTIPVEFPENATPADLQKLATESAEEALTKLVDRYPGWFAGGPAGVGTPAGPGGGPMPEDWMALPEEVQRNMSDEDFAKHYGSKRPKKKRRTLLG